MSSVLHLWRANGSYALVLITELAYVCWYEERITSTISACFQCSESSVCLEALHGNPRCLAFLVVIVTIVSCCKICQYFFGLAEQKVRVR